MDIADTIITTHFTNKFIYTIADIKLMVEHTNRHSHTLRNFFNFAADERFLVKKILA